MRYEKRADTKLEHYWTVALHCLPTVEKEFYQRRMDGRFASTTRRIQSPALRRGQTPGSAPQRAEASPYVNHLIEVAELLAREGGVTDVITLQAAILHDTLEDTETTPAELDAHFGVEVRRIVEEVTDDQTLSKAERKRLQIVHARHLSERAKLVKLADKIANLRSLLLAPPVKWSLKQKQEYVPGVTA